jgi:hypothetical protein
MTPAQQVRLACEAVGGQTKLAGMLDSHVPGKKINPRTVRRWVAGKASPHPLLLEKIIDIAAHPERYKEE